VFQSHPLTDLNNFLAFGKLALRQEGLYEFALAADGHFWESLEPSTGGNFRLGIKPRGQQSELAGGNAALPNAVEQMLEQGRRKVLPANLRHEASHRRSRA